MGKLMMISALAVAASRFALADSFTIDRDNMSGVLCSAEHPCGTVTVIGSSTLNVSITMNSGFGIFGNNTAFGFSTVGSNTGVTLSDFSSTLFNGTGGTGNEDGWGSFEFRVDGPGGASAVQNLSFTVTRSENPFTSPADIEQGATGGNGFTIFGLHVRNNSSGLTGYAGVDASPATVTPEPASIGLLGLGSVAFVLIRKRQTQAKAKA